MYQCIKDSCVALQSVSALPSLFGSTYNFSICYLYIVSVASMFSPENWRLYENFKKFNGSYMLANSKFHFNFVKYNIATYMPQYRKIK